MAGEPYTEDEVTRFLKHDPTVPAAEQQPPAAHVDVQADVQPIVCDERMMADTPSASAMQLELQEVPPMVGVRHPPPEAPMPLYYQTMPGESMGTMPLHPGDHMVNELMPVVQQKLGESPAITPPLFEGQGQHMVGESPSAMALPHQQMLSDTPATMPRHPHSHMINELLQVLEQRLGETTAAMPQDDGHGEHMMGEPSVRIPLQYQQMMVDHPPVAYGFTDLDGDLGLHGLFLENEEHLPGGNGVTGMSEPPAVPSVVPLAPAPEQQPSCQDCHVVQLARSHNAAIGMVTTLSLHLTSDGTYTHTVLEITGAQGPNSGSQLIYESLRDCAQEDVARIVDSLIGTMRSTVGPVEEVIIAESGAAADAEVAMSSGMVDAAGPSSAPEMDTLRAAPVVPPPPRTQRQWPQQPARVLSPAEQEDEETRQYLQHVREQVEKEMSSLPLALKRFCRDTKNPDKRSLILRRIKQLNNKIKDSPKEGWGVGSELTKIRTWVDGLVTEKTRLYATLVELMEKEGKSCHVVPPRRDDDETGGSGGAAGAAVS
ncbi:hypothetical protein VPH35_005061 [Triticum aestivum]|nr:uncharacterized protein LOC123182109 [Triticum aestivum]